MLGLNMKIAAGVAVVVALLSGVAYWQHGRIIELNKSIGKWEQQNNQLAADLMFLMTENKQLTEYNKRAAEITGERDAKQQERIRQLEADAAIARRQLQEDPDAVQWLDSGVPGSVSRRLCQLFPATDEDGQHVCGAAAAGREADPAPGVAGQP